MDEDLNGKITSFHIAYLKTKVYLGEDLTRGGLYSSWDDEPSPWLDAILAKVGKKMSDWDWFFEFGLI